MVDECKDVDWSRLSVLVVDDHPFMCNIMKATLLELGVNHIDIAENGVAAMDNVSWASRPFDIVLCDLEMPDMDGFEFVRYLRNDPMQSDVPILVVSGHSNMESVMRAVHRGINGYLVKPVSKLELERRIRIALNSRIINPEMSKEKAQKWCS